jgi:selenocysteine lyase/cysteine desulfurase
MTTLLRRRRTPAPAAPPANPETLDVQAVRRHFAFPDTGRIVTNNAASTQPPRELTALYASLAPGYENVHRGQSTASQLMTDMIAEGRVFPDRVDYNDLPWKYAAGTPNILGAIVSAQALRLLLDLALSPDHPVYFGGTQPLERAVVRAAMGRVHDWNQRLTGRALAGLSSTTTPPRRSTRPWPPSPPSPADQDFS